MKRKQTVMTLRMPISSERPKCDAPMRVQEVYEDDEAHRVQAIMLGEEHDPVLESEKQAAAATFQLGPRKTPP
jgi:hypothetical protein